MSENKLIRLPRISLLYRPMGIREGFGGGEVTTSPSYTFQKYGSNVPKNLFHFIEIRGGVQPSVNNFPFFNETFPP